MLEGNEITQYEQTKRNPTYSVGDLCIAKIVRKAPGVDGFFVDIGHGKDALLQESSPGNHIYANIAFIERTIEGKSITTPQPDPSIVNLLDVLQPEQKIVVEISKEVINTKGARVTTRVNLLGHYIILTPFHNQLITSQKITDNQERKRLQKIISAIKPRQLGIVIRTDAQHQTETSLVNEVNKLHNKWQRGCEKLKKNPKPGRFIAIEQGTNFLYRHFFDKNLEQVIVDTPQMQKKIKEYFHNIQPNKEGIIHLYQGKQNLLAYLGLDKTLESLLSTSVSIPGGGNLVIEQKEALALCAIDINAGGSIANEEDKELTAIQVNLSAAKEIARQLQLRNIGGIIIIDFIGMRKPENKKKIYLAMKEHLQRDDANSTILPLSPFCLMEMTRKRTKPMLTIENTEECPTCRGNGTIQPSIDIVRYIKNQLNLLLHHQKRTNVTINVHPYLHAYLHKGFPSKKWKWIFKHRQWITIKPDSSLPMTHYRISDKKGNTIATQPNYHANKKKEPLFSSTNKTKRTSRKHPRNARKGL